MNHVNQLIDMEYKEELEKLHARDREETAFSEARIKELEAQLQNSKLWSRSNKKLYAPC